MNTVYYISENKLYKKSDKKPELVSLDRVETYKENSRQISKRNEWKNQGNGAQFTGTAIISRDTDEILEKQIKLPGVCKTDDELIYSVIFEGVSGIYTKSLDPEQKSENLIISSQNFRANELAYKKRILAATLSYNNGEKHVVLFKMPSANYDEIIDGDTIEESPFWISENELVFSECGIGRTENGQAVEYSPKSLMTYNCNNSKMDTIIESDKYDYTYPQTDDNGTIYCIRRPYKEKVEKTNILIDVLLFPVRIIKAILGFLNVFSILFGGESLNSANKDSGQYKLKQKSQKDLVFENNIINAEKNLKTNKNSGDKYPGLIPRSWQLIKINSDNSEEVIKSGVSNELYNS